MFGHFQCAAWINMLCDHTEKWQPEGWILTSEQPQNCVLCTGECLIHANIYTSDMSSKTRYFPLITVSDSWDHSWRLLGRPCSSAVLCFSLAVPWTRRAGHAPCGRVVAKSPNHPACVQDERWKGTCDLRITASCGPKCAPTVKPNLLKRRSRLIKEKEGRVPKEGDFCSSLWDYWRLI